MKGVINQHSTEKVEVDEQKLTLSQRRASSLKSCGYADKYWTQDHSQNVLPAYEMQQIHSMVGYDTSLYGIGCISLEGKNMS